MIVVQGASHYFHAVAGGAALPALAGRLRPLLREHHRRIDRFIELALLGSAECVAGHSLAPDCGLYISSGFGPIGTNVVVEDAVTLDAKLPMPFNFVNTLGSSAGFYVGKNLGLAGESVFLSRRGGSFSAALACAAADLESGVVSQMLVGAIEECLLPAARFRDLAGLPAAARTAEGTHWLLLARGEGDGAPVARERLEPGEFDGYESADAARLTSFVARHAGMRFGLRVEHGSHATLVAR